MFQIREINRQIRENPGSYIEKYDYKYDVTLNKLANDICNNLDQHRIVMVSGPSSSGKTTSSLKIGRFLQQYGIHAHTISMDDFFLSQEDSPKKADGTNDFETVLALDLALFEECIKGLIAGKTVGMPNYDFHTGTCNKDAYQLKLTGNDIVVVEGIHALNDLVTIHLPQEKTYKIYVSVSSNIFDGEKVLLGKRQLRFLRRLVRDFRYRSASADLTFTLWQHVLEGELKYVLPNKCKANLCMDTTFPFDPALMKAQAVPLLEEAAKIDKWNMDATKLLNALQKVEAADPVYLPKTALIREFIGGSAFHGQNN